MRYAGEYYRRNEIWRTLVDRWTGQRVRDELVKENFALVKLHLVTSQSSTATGWPEPRPASGLDAARLGSDAGHAPLMDSQSALGTALDANSATRVQEHPEAGARRRGPMPGALPAPRAAGWNNRTDTHLVT